MEAKKQAFSAFRLLLLGRSGVGKTYNGLRWALDLLKQGVFKAKRVILISKTWKSDSSQEEFVKYCQGKYKGFRENNCFEDIDTKLLSRLFDTQKLMKEMNPQKLKNWLVVFDDQISSALIKRQESDPALKNLFCVGRHYGISQIWMLQRFRGTIDPTCRDQFTMISIFKQGNKKGLMDLLQDYDESPEEDHKIGLKNLFQSYLESVSDNDGHGAFTIHVLKGHGEGRLERGLGSNVFFDRQ